MSEEIVSRFKALYAKASGLSREQLETIYEPGIVFKDPIHQIEGMDTLAEYMETMYGNVRHCRFDYLDEIVATDRAMVKWDMTFSHKKLGRGKDIVVRGVTIIEYRELIFRHEDVFDLGSMIYENVPLLGFPVRLLKHRLDAA